MSNETKTTKSYKLSPELKEKLERLAAESGLETQEAFIEQLAAIYELQQLKEGSGSGYAKQIEELEYHRKRSVELFISMLNTESATRLQMNQQHDEILAERAATIFSQEQEISEMKKAAKTQSEELQRVIKEGEAAAKLVEQLQESVRDKTLIIDQRGQEIATLSSLVNEYKAAADDNKALSAEVSRLNTLTEKHEHRAAAMESELKLLTDRHNEEIRLITDRQQQEIERLTDRKDIEKERETIAIRTEYQTKLEAAQNEATAKIRELYGQLENQRTEYESRIRELLLQQQQSQNVQPPTQ